MVSASLFYYFNHLLLHNSNSRYDTIWGVCIEIFWICTIVSCIAISRGRDKFGMIFFWLGTPILLCAFLVASSIFHVGK